MTAPLEAPLEAALARLRAGGLVAYPTETLWGLGADARDEAAVARLRAWKGREAAQPISILVEGLEALEGLGFALGPVARELARRCWPGPLTLVLPCRGRFAAGVARADGAVGVRCSPHPVARALARRVAAAGLGPLTATSLNRSGAAPACTRAEARALCQGADAPLLLDAEDAPEPSGLASTVVDATASPPIVLRWGALDSRRLAPALSVPEEQPTR